MNANMIAPCGMNCVLCIGHIREKNRCEGCNGNEQSKPQSCRTCSIVLCEKRLATDSGFCFDCPHLRPYFEGFGGQAVTCARMKQLDKRYRTKYGMSMFENLAFIQEHGLDAFIKSEEERWACPECGATLSVHRTACVECSHPREVMSYACPPKLS
jgi:hypothetical protein